MPEQSFGEWLREQRSNCDLSQDKAGKRIGVSGAAISGWESGASVPDPSRFAAIESTYHLPAGAVSAMLKAPETGPSLDYWIGRWEQQTMHFRRLLTDQEDLLEMMRRAGGAPLTPPATPEALEAATRRQLAADATAAAARAREA